MLRLLINTARRSKKKIVKMGNALSEKFESAVLSTFLMYPSVVRETGHPYSGLVAKCTDHTATCTRSWLTVLSKLISSQPPGAEAHIVDPL